MTEFRADTRRSDFKIELLVVFAILVSLGFPGNFTVIFGDRLGTVMEYAAFVIEILAMLLSSGSSWLNIRLINLDRKYTMIYLLAAVLFVESMLVSRYPSLQFITCFRLTVTILFAIWLQEHFRFVRVVELICIAQAIFLLFNLLFMLLYPGRAFESGASFFHALRGLYETKNTFAYEMIFGIISMSFLVREKREKQAPCKFWVLLLLAQAVMLLMCQSTGAIFCLLVVLLPLALRDRVRLPLGWVMILGSIGFLLVALLVIPHMEWFFYAIGKDPTLTGRIPFWNQVLSVITTHKTLTGYGYSMFWRDPQAIALIHAGFSEYSFMGTMTSGAHNMLLDLWLNIGLVGLGMFFATLLYSMRRMAEIPQNKYLFCSMFVIFLTVNGMVERCLTGSYSYKVFSIFLVMAACCNRPQAEKQSLFPLRREEPQAAEEGQSDA